MRVRLTCWIALSVLAAHRGNAQATEPTSVLRGRVIDARTAAPLRDVTVVITSGADTVGRARTDSIGTFESLLRPATALVAHFVRIGYRADSATAPGTSEFPLRVAMTPVSAASNTLAAMVVRDTARSSFERRARRNAGGSFIRREDIEKKKPLRTSDLFRSLPGVRIDDSSGVTQLVSIRSIRQTAPTARQMRVGGETISMPSTNAERCVVRIGINGRLTMADFSIDDIRPVEVAGIEVYLGAATIPTEFSSVQHDAPCGIVMIWTKTGTER